VVQRLTTQNMPIFIHKEIHRNSVVTIPTCIINCRYRHFFVRYDEPTHVKHLKVDILPLIANDKNARDIAAELVEVSEKMLIREVAKKMCWNCRERREEVAKTEGWKRSERGRPSVEEEQRRVGERREKGGRDKENGGGIGAERSMMSHFTLTAGAIYLKSYLLIVLRSACNRCAILYSTV
jgi:hypothetical protein